MKVWIVTISDVSNYNAFVTTDVFADQVEALEWGAKTLKRVREEDAAVEPFVTISPRTLNIPSKAGPFEG